MMLMPTSPPRCRREARRRRGTDESDAATRDDAFLDRGAGRVERVLDPGLLFLHLDLGRRADADDGDAADQLGETLLELLTVVVGGGFLDLRPDLLDAALDVGPLAGAVDDGAVVLVDDDPLGLAEVVERDAFELDAELFGDDLAAGQDGDVLEHGFAACRSPGPTCAPGYLDLVDHERGQRSPSTSSNHDECRPVLAICSSNGSRSFIPEIFFSWMRT
jgi:hypothetical protein